jgi:hypothetical protein
MNQQHRRVARRADQPVANFVKNVKTDYNNP